MVKYLTMSSFNYYNWQSPYPIWGSGTAFTGFPADQHLHSSQGNASATQLQASCGTQSQSTPSQTNFHAKVLNPSNKRDGKIYTRRNILQEDLDSSSKIKDLIASQCGDEAVPLPADMVIGYFHGSNKFWINNRLDVNDVWKLVNEGEKVTFWCTGVDRSCAKPKKRTLNEESEASQSTKKLKGKLEE